MARILELVSRGVVGAFAVAMVVGTLAFALKSTNIRYVNDLAGRIWHGVVPSYGLIYVESPEVYTRQRLVNDRFEHEYWLRNEMERLDSDGSKVTGADMLEAWRQDILDIQITYPADSASEGAGSTEKPTGDADGLKLSDLASAMANPPKVPYQTEFFLKSAIRDKIRSMSLENALDDRHDLQGNTVFGLKFDTAIIPGSYTRLRPTVIVELEVDPFYSRALGRRVEIDELISHELDALAPSNGETPKAFASRKHEVSEVRDRLDSHFRRWVSDIQKRFDDYSTYASSYCQPHKYRSPKLLYEEAVKYYLDRAVNVEGILQTANDNRSSCGGDSQDLSDPTSILLPLSGPWSNYFDLYFESAGSRIRVSGKQNWVHLLDSRDLESVPNGRRLWTAPSLESKVADADDSLRIAYGTASDDFGLKMRELLSNISVEGQAQLSKEFTENHTAMLYSDPACNAVFVPPEEGDDKNVDDKNVDVLSKPLNTGFLAFARAVFESQPYAYAAFPRGDVAGVVIDSQSQAMLSAAYRGDFGVKVGEGEQSVRAEPTIINFASSQPRRRGGSAGRDRPGETFDFGWTVVKPGKQEPMQASQLVLVSIPAYLDKLRMKVTRGWLDVDAAHGQRERLLKQQEVSWIEIPVPPDYEAMDTLVDPELWRQDPKVNEEALCAVPRGAVHGREPIFSVRSGDRADLMIPGERLWRSAVVMIGGQPADRIRVLPDMRGILASFDRIGVPAATCRDGKSPLADLVIWTSEGSIPLRNAVRFANPPSAAGVQEAAAAGTASNTTGTPAAVKTETVAAAQTSISVTCNATNATGSEDLLSQRVLQ